MWYYAIQASLIFAAIVIALGIRYTLVDRHSALPTFHRIYLLQTTRVKKLQQHITQWTWLMVLLVIASVLTLFESAPQTSFYPYGRFNVQQAKVQVSPTPTATPTPHQVHGRFGVVTSETSAQ